VKPPILIGLGIAVVIIAASLLAPRLRDPGRQKAEQAQDQAALAERELARHSVTLPLADTLAPIREMKGKEGELAAAVVAATEPLKAAGAEYSKLTRIAQELARRYELPAPTPPPLSTDAAGIQRAFQSLVKENQALLGRALKDAAAAAATDGEALGVQQAVGMGEYVRAAELLTEAQVLRVQQAEAQARLLDVAAQWKAAQGLLDYYRGLDAAPVVAGLRTDLEELGVRRTEADAAVQQLSGEVTTCRQALEQVEQDLAMQQQEWLALQKQGFQAGQDEGEHGFDQYRERYLALSETVRKLQQQEQELRYGGRHGAQVADENWATGEIQNGEAVGGVEELQRRLDIAQERARRFAQATTALDEHIRYVTGSGQQAQTESSRYQERMTQLEAAAQEIAAGIEKLAAEALNNETEALKAAESAVRAFGQSQRATEAWIRAVREVQRDKDPTRKNERLDQILKDPYLEHVPRSAEASARVLAGRIHLQRVESGASLLGDMRVFTETYTDPRFSFDPTTFESQVETARAAGLETLQKAAETYTTISDKLSNATTVWVPLGAAAATYDLLSRIDPTQTGVFLGKATELIQKVVEKRELFPYARPFVLFRDHLAGMTAPAPTEARPGETKKAEEETDFFQDEK